MQRALVTGIHGTIGSRLAPYLKNQDVTVIPWERKKIPVSDSLKTREFLDKNMPDTIFQLAIASQPTGLENEPWKINCEWPEQLAKLSADFNIKFIFASTVMVFTEKKNGPYHVSSRPNALEGYGFEKLAAEVKIRKANPNATIARLGWQIGDAAGSNNMIDFFESRMKNDGYIDASDKWLPACSFIDDTVKVLSSLAEQEPGTYMIDSNKKWSFYEISNALNNKLGQNWDIRKTDDFEYDQRMIDNRIHLPSLKDKLQTLN